MTFIQPIAAATALTIAVLSFAAPAEARSRHRHWHHGHHGYHGHGGHGDALAAGIVGLAAGAIIAGALAQPREPQVVYPASDWVAYCSAKYRTYDPATNLFVGYDGRYHQCR